MARIFRNERLLWYVAMALTLGGIAYLAGLPEMHMPAPIDEFRKQCNGDEACAQKLEAQRRINMQDYIQTMSREALARQDAAKRASRQSAN